MENIYNKVLLYQYGKVGSTSLKESNFGMYYEKIQVAYPCNMIQVHKHNIARDIISKQHGKKNLVINIQRLPIDRNISWFYQWIDNEHPTWKGKTTDKLIEIYNENHSVRDLDRWMEVFCRTLKLDLNFTFDKTRKYTIIETEKNTILFFKYEDYDYVCKYLLKPQYGINCNKTLNVSSEKKRSGESFVEFKKTYKITHAEKEYIRNSFFYNKFYTKEQIEEHIKKYS